MALEHFANSKFLRTWSPGNLHFIYMLPWGLCVPWALDRKSFDVASEDVVLTPPCYPGMWPSANPFASLGLSFPVSETEKVILNNLQGGEGLFR